jgi:hypothetical protein
MIAEKIDVPFDQIQVDADNHIIIFSYRNRTQATIGFNEDMVKGSILTMRGLLGFVGMSVEMQKG